MPYDLIIYIEGMKEKKYTIQELKEMKELIQKEPTVMGISVKKIKEKR